MDDMLNLQINQRLQQKLILTPAMKQSLRILQMSATQLLTEVNNILQENPALEEMPLEIDNESYIHSDDRDEKNIEDELSNDDWLSSCEDETSNYYKPKYSNDKSFENFVAKEIHLTEYLLFQLNISGLSSSEKRIGEYIIGNLDDDGYFRLNIESCLKHLNVEEKEFLKVLNVIQGFDPSGIAARNFRECVVIQLYDMGIEQDIINLIDIILTNYSDNIVNEDYKTIINNLKVNKEDFNVILSLIKKIDPKPGCNFDDNNKYIYPDVYIFENKGDIEVIINERNLPHLTINNYYLNLLNDNSLDIKTKMYIEEKIKDARWFIKSLNNRQSAIQRVVKAIINIQRDFFDKGLKYLKPMKLKDIAEITGLHESTISRVTSGKYAYCKYGLIELKLFFAKGYETSTGNLTVDNIKEVITNIIKNEPNNAPYSDSSILNILHKQGIDIARRTVAKYREELKIPSKKYRKREVSK